MENQRSIIRTSCPDISEKIIMNATTEDIVAHVRDWSIERAANKKVLEADARAILAEFYEWIEPEDDELEIAGRIAASLFSRDDDFPGQLGKKVAPLNVIHAFLVFYLRPF
jgi:hypothetical protein